jgi:hypothetical protein
VDCWDWTEAIALSRVPEPWRRIRRGGSCRTYLGAGAQGPQASVTSRTKQLEHSLIISWINLLSRVCRGYREAEAEVKRQLPALLLQMVLPEGAVAGYPQCGSRPLEFSPNRTAFRPGSTQPRGTTTAAFSPCQISSRLRTATT